MSPYHRLDIAMQYISLIKNRWISTIELSVFNVYNRANSFYYTLENNDLNSQGVLQLKQVSILPIVPSLSWTVKF